jgi:spore maturation protein A
MAMSILWTAMIAVSILCGAANGTLEAVSASAAEGAQAAVSLCISMAGMLCLWMGVMEIMSRCGILQGVQRLLQPLLGRLFPDVAGDSKTMELIAGNVSANLLGIGNAATPLGIQAVQRMAQRSQGVTTDSMCLFVVCNTASIQLIPTTVAALRSAAGCATPFDILPCVWLTSGVALAVGILAAKGMRVLWGPSVGEGS